MHTKNTKLQKKVSRRAALKKMGLAAVGAAAGSLAFRKLNADEIATSAAGQLSAKNVTTAARREGALAKQISKWGSDARIAATRRFCEMLDKDPELRKACKADRKKAWETLKQAGDFEDMPNDVEIHVFENEVGSSDKMVTMVLPRQGELPPADIFDAKGVWLCTWSLYLQ